MNAVMSERPAQVSMTQACKVLSLNRSTVYARQARAADADVPARPRQPSVQPRALSTSERTAVMETLHSETYCDQPPAAVYHALLEQGRHLCSISTMHRLLRGLKESGDRRNQRQPQHHAVPRLLATAPNEVWTWDITKLPLVCRGVYL